MTPKKIEKAPKKITKKFSLVFKLLKMDEKLEGGAIQVSNQKNLIAKSTFPYEQNVTSKFPYEQDNVKKDSVSEPTFYVPTLSPKISPALETRGEGLTSSTSSTNLLNTTSQTYDSLFGKYGFYMSIDSDGEYVLNVMDNEFEYKAYLKKYEPEKYLEKYQDNTGDNVESNTNTNTNIESNTNTNIESNTNTNTNVEGGKRKTIRQKYYKRKTQKGHKKTNKKY